MLLRNLFEAAAPDADAAFAFGRFNPAHQGHIEVYKAVQQAGNKWFIGTNPSTHGPNDPLTFEEKSAWMQAIYPPIKGHILPEQSVVTLASKLYEMLGDDKTIAYVTDSNDWAWAGKLLNDYNGKEGPHGYYNFRAIKHVESPRVSSATALRTAARANDEAAFYAASGTDPKLTVGGKTYFETVVDAVGAHPEKVKKVAKKKEPAVAEVSKSTLDRYITKAVDAHGHADFAARQSKDDPSKRSYHVDQKKTAEKRRQGISRALDRMSKEGVAEDAGKEFAYQGYKIKFTPNQLVILKGGDVALTRPGDFSNPTKQQMIVARKYIDQMWQKEKEHQQSPNISQQHDLYGANKEYNKLQKEISQFLEPFNKERMKLVHSTRGDKDAWMTGLNALHQKYQGSPEYKELEAKHTELRTKLNALKKGNSWNKKDMDEANSNAMADTAKRLANKDDGKVAKLRAAGDKRREEELKGRNIVKRNESVDLKTSLQELSNDMLGKYKKAAGADATKADKEGNVKRGDKRFSGIVKATNKQFANDAKKTK